MIRKAFGLTIIGTFLAVAAMAGPPDKKTDKVDKVVVLHTCPMTGEAVKGAGVGAETVGKYKISFCCAGCPEQFNAMSKKDQLKKLAEIEKKESKAKPKS
jgi:hypothetical protein